MLIWHGWRCMTFVGTAIRSGPGRLPLPWNVGIQSVSILPFPPFETLTWSSSMDWTCHLVVPAPPVAMWWSTTKRDAYAHGARKSFAFCVFCSRRNVWSYWINRNESWFKSCKNPVAPKQTVIPVWSQAAWILCYGFIYFCAVWLIIYSL